MHMKITGVGSVGIGTPAPRAKLDVNAQNNNADVFRVDSNGNSGPVSFIIDKNGNVGIGTSAPTSKLHVNGDMNVDGIPKFTKAAFDCANGGCLALIAKAGTSCATVCTTHGMNCNESVTFLGVAGACSLTAVDYTCACGG